MVPTKEIGKGKVIKISEAPHIDHPQKQILCKSWANPKQNEQIMCRDTLNES